MHTTKYLALTIVPSTKVAGRAVITIEGTHDADQTIVADEAGVELVFGAEATGCSMGIRTADKFFVVDARDAGATG